MTDTEAREFYDQPEHREAAPGPGIKRPRPPVSRWPGPPFGWLLTIFLLVVGWQGFVWAFKALGFS